MKRLPALLLALLALPVALGAGVADAVDDSMQRFFSKEDRQYQYKGTRRLEAENRDRSGWLEAETEFSPTTGFRYQVTAEGGSSFVRDRVLRAVLDAERELAAKRTPGRFALAHANYTFAPKGIDPQGLAAIALSPKREDHVLLEGTMFLRPSDGDLVRVQGRLVKNPSFWVKRADVTRRYESIGGVVVPVELSASAQLRLFGPATMRMTFSYAEIDGRPVETTIVRR